MSWCALGGYVVVSCSHLSPPSLSLCANLVPPPLLWHRVGRIESQPALHACEVCLLPRGNPKDIANDKSIAVLAALVSDAAARKKNDRPAPLLFLQRRRSAVGRVSCALSMSRSAAATGTPFHTTRALSTRPGRSRSAASPQLDRSPPRSRESITRLRTTGEGDHELAPPKRERSW